MKRIQAITFYRDFLDDMFPGMLRRSQILEASRKFVSAFRAKEVLGIVGAGGGELRYDRRRDGWTVRLVTR